MALYHCCVVARTLLALLFIVAGCTHFARAEMYARIVPPMLPHPVALVFVSGVAEIAGGIGLLVPFTRRAAAWGLVALLIAVFPANIYMAVNHVQYGGWFDREWIQWARLPLQLPLIWWAWLYTRRDVRRSYAIREST